MRAIILALHANNLPETGKRQHENAGTRVPPRRDGADRGATQKKKIGATIFSAKRNATRSGAAQHRQNHLSRLRV